MPPTSIKTKFFNILSIICACHLFFAGLNLPDFFYVYLKVIVFSVAILTMIKNIGISNIYVLTFGVVALVFNPIFPTYLYDKAVWVLVDIIAALLFLMEAFEVKSSMPSELATKKRKRQFKYRFRSLLR